MTSPYDLTTLANVKNRAMVSSDADDGAISAAITGFSKYLKDWTGQGSLNSIVQLTENYDGNGNSRMFLRTYPIITLNSVSILYGGTSSGIPLSNGVSWGAYIDTSKKSIGLRGNYGNYPVYPFQSSGYGPFLGGTMSSPRFPRGQANIQVVYSAGVEPTTITNEIDVVTGQTITLQSGFPWFADGGVAYYPSLTPLTNVPSAPVAGEYAVSNGLYVFASADNGANVAVTYEVSAPPPDLEYAVRCVVAINYLRKGWQDTASRVVNAGGSSATTRYQAWAWPSEYQDVFANYKRESFIA